MGFLHLGEIVLIRKKRFMIEKVLPHFLGGGGGASELPPEPPPELQHFKPFPAASLDKIRRSLSPHFSLRLANGCNSHVFEASPNDSIPPVKMPNLLVSIATITTRIISPMTATIIILMDMPWAFFLSILLLLKLYVYKYVEIKNSEQA